MLAQCFLSKTKRGTGPTEAGETLTQMLESRQRLLHSKYASSLPGTMSLIAHLIPELATPLILGAPDGRTHEPVCNYTWGPE